MTRKFIHCQLNTWGYTRWDEVKFGLSHAVGSLWMVVFGKLLGSEDRAAELSWKWIAWTRTTPKYGKKP